MKFNTEDYLYKLDQKFADKEEKEVYMIYLLIAGGLIFLSYYFLWDSSKAGYDQALQASQNLEKKIVSDTHYLKSHPEAMITQIENQTKLLEEQFTQYQDSNAYIKYQIEQISSLYYDEQAWGEYIDSVATNAKKYNIKIEHFTNSFAKDKNEFGHVLDINVKSYGRFHDLLRYINSLEQSFLVVDIHNFSLAADDKLHSDLQISVWGITY
jgi:hypothetical protein